MYEETDDSGRRVHTVAAVNGHHRYRYRPTLAVRPPVATRRADALRIHDAEGTLTLDTGQSTVALVRYLRWSPAAGHEATVTRWPGTVGEHPRARRAGRQGVIFPACRSGNSCGGASDYRSVRPETGGHIPMPIVPLRLSRRRGLAAVALVATAAAFLAGCGEKSDADAAGAAPSPSASAAVLTVKDPWVKAAASGMTAAFGILSNDTDRDVTITSVTSPASPMELHEMAMKDGKMVMQPKAGGIVVKAKSTHELKPGGDHLMLMNPSAPIKPGDEVTFTLALAGGGSVVFTAIAKPFAGAGESYDPGGSMPMPSGMPAPSAHG